MIIMKQKNTAQCCYLWPQNIEQDISIFWACDHSFYNKKYLSTFFKVKLTSFFTTYGTSTWNTYGTHTS